MLNQLRPINLFIIVLTHYVIAYSFLQKFIAYSNRFHFDFFLLTLATISISAFGYLHNDFCDIDIDKINKPEKVIDIKNTKIGIYISLTISVLISIYLCLTYRNYSVIVFNTLVVLLLFYYNKYGKKQFLIGNIIVSFLCALVPAILYFYFLNFVVIMRTGEPGISFYDLPILLSDYAMVIILFCCFAFVITFIREVIKDLEDMEGDKIGGASTVPIMMGVNWTKFMLLFPYILLAGLSSTLVLLTQFILKKYGNDNGFLNSTFITFYMLIPNLMLLFFLIKANKKVDYRRISIICKILMFIGLCLMLVL